MEFYFNGSASLSHDSFAHKQVCLRKPKKLYGIDLSRTERLVIHWFKLWQIEAR